MLRYFKQTYLPIGLVMYTVYTISILYFIAQGKFQEAAKLYKKAGIPSKVSNNLSSFHHHIIQAVEMYTDLREFDLAKEFMVETEDVKQFMTKQADWCKTTNDPTAAMYVTIIL